MMALEPRFMFDAAGVATAGVVADKNHDAATPVPVVDKTASGASDSHTDLVSALAKSVVMPAATVASKGVEIAFIDSRVQDSQTLIADLRPGVQLVILDPNMDGIAQITQALQNAGTVSSVHILTHGAPGELFLGSTALTGDVLMARSGDISGWHANLTAGADILIYGCDVAQGSVGQQFVQSFAKVTGADVAASTDATGGASKGGNWTLETATGPIEAVTVLTAEGVADYQSLLAVPSVTGIQRQTPSTATSSADTVTFRVTFSEAVQNVDGTDFTFAPGSVNGATIQLVTPVAGSNGTQYDVLVGNVVTANGTVNLDVRSDNNIQSLSSDHSALASASSGVDETYTLSHSFAPSVVAVSTDSGFSATDGNTNDKTLTITGTAVAGTSIQVFLNGSVIGTAATGSTGSWSLDYTGKTLLDGSYSITATATDVSGNTSGVSSAYSLVVDTVAPIVTQAVVNGSQLILTYSDTSKLDATNIPVASMFAVAVNGTADTVTGVSVNDAARTVTLTLAIPAASGQSVTVTYTDPAGDTSNAIQDLAGNDAATSTPSVFNITGYTTPVITGVSGSTWFSLGSTAATTVLSSSPILMDLTKTTLQSADITITGYQAGDILSVGTLPVGITTTGFSLTGHDLKLTGTGTLADYQAALEQITFSTTALNYSDRTISFKVNDGADSTTTASRTMHVMQPAFSLGASTTAYLVANAVTTGTNGSYLDLMGVDLLKNTVTIQHNS